MVEFTILHGGSKALSRTRSLNYWKANFDLFKDLLRGIPWVRALEQKGFYKYSSTKRETGENVESLLNQKGVLVTEDTEKAELLKAFF